MSFKIVGEGQRLKFSVRKKFISLFQPCDKSSAHYPVFQHNSTPSLIKHTTKCLVAFRTCTLVYTLHNFPISECNSLANQFFPKKQIFFSSQSKQIQNLRSLNEIELKSGGWIS